MYPEATENSTGSPGAEPAGNDAPASGRAPYRPPVLEPLGAWSALTLQQSIPIGPGSFLTTPGRPGRLV